MHQGFAKKRLQGLFLRFTHPHATRIFALQKRRTLAFKCWLVVPAPLSLPFERTLPWLRCPAFLSLLPAHKAEWMAERDKRQKWVTYLRQERAKGIGKTGEARKCGSRKTSDGSPCQNEKHYREGSGWGPCTIPGH